VGAAELPEALHHAALVSDGKELILVGGFHGGLTHVWRMRGAVYRLQGDGWVEDGELPRPQAEGVLASSPAGDIHLATGQSPRGDANSERSDHAEVHDHLVRASGSNTWESLAPIPTARNSATGGWIGKQLIVTGGRTADGNLDVTEIYDLQEDRWRTAAPLPLPQAGTASAVVQDGLIVFGGEIFQPESAVFPNVWQYSLSKDEWTALPDMPIPRHGIGAGRFGNEIFVVGGATEPGGSGTSDANEVLVLGS
jgi:N-acetylneuraminic acid mutarotase